MDAIPTTYTSDLYSFIFMDIVGEPISAYIRKRKLSCAAKELINTNKTILDIALSDAIEEAN